MRDSAGLSITLRLTVTSALLTGAVLLSATLLLYFMGQRSIEREATRGVRMQAEIFAEGIVRQLDEDLLVEFGGRGMDPGALQLHSNDWALVHGNKKVVRASGIFQGELDPLHSDPSRVRKTAGGRTFRTAAVPLPLFTGLSFDELPEPVRNLLSRESPGKSFLRAKREVSRGTDVFEIKLLEDSTLIELKITELGKLLSKKGEKLPGELPQDLVRGITEGREGFRINPPTWTGSGGQLLAAVKGQTPAGEAFEVVMNRLGERFQVDSREGVVGPQEEWRLFLLAATDASAEAFSRRSLVFALSVGGALSWVVLILAGFYVVRKAMSPVQEIVNAVEHIRLSDLQKRLPATKARDELSRIASTINNMLDRLERAYRRERQFTGDASHELRGPLTKVLGEIELALSRERSAEEYRAALESCRRYAETMKALVESLITLARLDSGSKSLAETSLDLGDLAVETIGRFQPEESGSS